MNSAVIFQIQSFCILLLMYYGASQWRKRSRHVKLMASSIVWDILLILQIEFTRSAIKTASNFSGTSDALKIHLLFAVSCVICYAAMIYTGRKILRGQEVGRIRPIHKILGRTTLGLRTLTLITSFWAAQGGPN